VMPTVGVRALKNRRQLLKALVHLLGGTGQPIERSSSSLLPLGLSLSILVAVSALPSLIHSRLPSMLATGSSSGSGRPSADSVDSAGIKVRARAQPRTSRFSLADRAFHSA
jgi:hypothetical protein